MIDIQVGKRYAEAIYEISEERKEIKEIYELLNSVMELYKKDKDFKNFITSPLINFEEKTLSLREIFKEFKEENLEILFYILNKNRIEAVREIVAEFLKIHYRKNRILDVKAVFTRELTEEQREKLITKLSRKTGKEINLEVVVDKNILGGGILKIGDKIIDGSIRRDLESWKIDKS